MVRECVLWIMKTHYFDRVDWKRLLHALKRIGIHWRDRRLIGHFYMRHI